MSKGFLFLFYTQFLGAVNDNIFRNALAAFFIFILAEEIGINSALYTQIAASLFILPFIIFSGSAGRIADSIEKSAWIRRIKVAEIFIMILGSIGFLLRDANFLLLVLFLMGTQSALFGPVKYSMIPVLVNKKFLVVANSYISSGTFIAIILGTLIGNYLILVEGGRIYILLLTVLCAFIGWRVSRGIPLVPPQQQKIHYHLWHDTVNIFKWRRNNKKQFLILVSISWFWFLGASVLTLLPEFVKNVFFANREVLSLFLVIFSLGFALGALLARYLLKTTIHFLFSYPALVFISIALIIFASISTYFTDNGYSQNLFQFFSQTNAYWCLFMLLILTLSGGIFIIPLYTYLQVVVDKKILSKVIALNNILNAIFIFLSAMSNIIFLKAGYSVQEIFFIDAILNLAFLFYWYLQKKHYAKLHL